jgi:hypothetical protein
VAVVIPLLVLLREKNLKKASMINHLKKMATSTTA